MARSSWTQTNFLGGQWGTTAQGRLDLPDYKIALAQCVNAYPQEDGSVTRRSGTAMLGPTRNGLFGVTIPWDISQLAIYDLEITLVPGSSQIRFWQADQPVLDSTAQITGFSGSSPTVMSLASPAGWATNDTIMITVGSLVGTTTQWAQIINRQLVVTVIDSQHFYLNDAVTGAAINGATLPGVPPSSFAGRLASYPVNFTTSTQLQQICAVATSFQNTQSLYLFAKGVQPVQITLTNDPSTGVWPTFSVVNPFFKGPYQPIDFNQNATVSASSGTVTLASVGSTQPNKGAGFQAGDVGRAIRFLSRPPPFDPAHAYAAGDAVMLNNQPWQATAPSTGKQPDQNPSLWAFAAQMVEWFDTKILSVIDTTHITISYEGSALLSQNGLTLATFTLGVFNASFNVWPSCGTFHESRLWLGGALPNQLDGGEIPNGAQAGPNISFVPVPNFNFFRPTDFNGNVTNASAVSYTLSSANNNTTLWMSPDQSGIVVGTQGEEWLVQATATNLPLTPTTMQAHRQTKYGSLLHQPVHAGLSLVFIQRYGNTIFEYLVDVFAQRFGALPLNERARQVTSAVDHLAYVENIFPIIWARTTPGGLVGCTYRRTSRFVSTPPEFRGWHPHTLAGISPTLISLGTNATTLPFGIVVDSVGLVTSNGPSYYRQILMPPYNPVLGDQFAWHLDGAVTGKHLTSTYQPGITVGLDAVEDGTNMYFNGLWYQPGTVSVYVGGVYFGDFPVVNGAVTVPYGSDPGGLGTRALMVSQLVAAGIAGGCFIQGLGTVPVCIGSKFTSTIKLLRQDAPDMARTQAGMSVGETRRPYMASALVGPAYNGVITIGVDNMPTYPMVFRQYIGGPPVANDIPFVGVWQDTVLADESYDGQLILNITGPQPFVLENITPFTETEER